MPEPQQAAPIRVDVPNLGTIEFPAGTSETDMKRAIDTQLAQSHVAKQEPVPHPIAQRLLDWLPAATGMAGGIIGGIAGAPAAGIGALPGAVAGAALGGATGEAWKQLANRAIGNPAPATGEEAAGQINKQIAIQGGSELIGGGVIAPIAGRMGSALMQSAVKPGIRTTARALARGVATEDLPIVKTLLKEGINVSPAGIAKLDRIISASNDEIKAAINSLPGTISPANVATRTQDVARRAANQVNPAHDVEAVESATKEFLTQPKTTMPGQVGTKQVPSGVLDASGNPIMRTQPVIGRVSRPLSLAEAQDLKTGTYRALKEKAYGELKAPAIEAQKALARGLKEEIESEAAKSGVDLGAANAREGAAIVTKEAIASRLAAAGNRDPVALAWLAHNPVSGMAFILERSPAVKSMLARGLYQSAATAARVPKEVMRVMLTALAQSDEDQP